MCGRFVQDINAIGYVEEFGLPAPPELPPRYNVAPGQQVAVVRSDAAGERELALLRWGLIPSWAKEASVGYRMINARAETAHEKPSFRQALLKRRCLVPASGFYEWRQVGKEKIPHYIRPADGGILSLAGLWERWAAPGGETVESFTILTTQANALLQQLHDRMPVIIDRKDYSEWLGGERIDTAVFFRPCAEGVLVEYEVSREVNSPGNDRPENILPV